MARPKMPQYAMGSVKEKTEPCPT
uniref:Uncharacterized protein n=1 Tax=mine drainage metagenome TaxID=410659 RepID=E6QKX9_9ZZZZ